MERSHFCGGLLEDSSSRSCSWCWGSRTAGWCHGSVLWCFISCCPALFPLFPQRITQYGPSFLYKIALGSCRSLSLLSFETFNQVLPPLSYNWSSFLENLDFSFSSYLETVFHFNCAATIFPASSFKSIAGPDMCFRIAIASSLKEDSSLKEAYR